MRGGGMGNSVQEVNFDGDGVLIQTDCIIICL